MSLLSVEWGLVVSGDHDWRVGVRLGLGRDEGNGIVGWAWWNSRWEERVLIGYEDGRYEAWGGGGWRHHRHEMSR